jgi:hypothetical protein
MKINKINCSLLIINIVNEITAKMDYWNDKYSELERYNPLLYHGVKYCISGEVFRRCSPVPF